jgi:hypothetical protein
VTRRGPVAVLAVLLVVALATPASAAVTTADSASTGSAAGPGRSLANPTAGSTPAADSLTGTTLPAQLNNTTVRHENPDRTDREGRLEMVVSHLSGRLADRLGESAVRISRSEYERARGLLGDGYGEDLAKLVDVAGDTGREGVGDAFERTRDAQREFADEVREFRETRDAYREAKQNGDERRARRLARELDADAENVSTTGARLEGRYDGVENATGASLADASAVVANTTAAVVESGREIRAAEFVPTTLTVSVATDRVSFSAPLTVRGRLATANGSALADRRVRLRIGERTLVADTDGDGRFAVDYRPVTTPTGPTALAVRYVPDAESLYYGANRTLSVTVEPVAPTVTVEAATDGTRFGEPVDAAGRVAVGDRGVPGLPLAVRVDGVRVASGRSGSDGSFDLSGALPADVAAGGRELSVVVAQRDRAVARAVTSREVLVGTTATALDLDARTVRRTGDANETGTAAGSTAGGRAVVTTGRLTSVDGDPIGGATVSLATGGSTVATATTDAAGRYRTQLPASAFGDAPADGDDRTVRVAAVYDEPGTNLGPSRANATVDLSGGASTPDEGAVEGSVDGPPTGPSSLLGGVLALLFGADGAGAGGVARLAGDVPWVGVGLGLGGAVLLAVGGVLWRRGDDEPGAVGAAAAGVDAGAGDDGDDENGTTDEPAPEPLGTARAALDGGRTGAAVRSAYAVVRAALDETGVDAPSSATHWEFARACHEAGVADPEALDALTATYERAAYGRIALSADEAEAALAAAETLLAGESGDGGRPPARA